jgi:hypothetical protein
VNGLRAVSSVQQSAGYRRVCAGLRLAEEARAYPAEDALAAQAQHASRMRKFRDRQAICIVPALMVTGLAAGCAGAPSIPVAGAYFPAWLACSLIGIAAALAARAALIATGRALPLPLLVCACVGIVCAAATWAAWVGL